jgi:sodium-coupled neutral amino acid transporter 11
MVIVVISTITIGLSWLVFKEKSQANILNAFPRDLPIITMCRLLFALDMVLTYPLELFIARDTIQMAFFGQWQGLRVFLFS